MNNDVNVSKEATPSCRFFVDRKKRFCRMSPATNSVFCCQHTPLNSAHSSRIRISCPLDHRHNCFQDELDKHLKRCNNRKKPQPEYYQENINSGNEITVSVPKLLLQYIPNETLLQVLKKIELIHGDIPPLSNRICSAGVLGQELINSWNGCEALKHHKQNASLIGILEQNQLLQDGNLFVEFGAGRGQLSHWVVQTQNKYGQSAFLLVDRASQRHKLDNRSKVELEIQRIKIDIVNLNLGCVPLVHKHDSVVVLSKHLCGAATDLALRCISNCRDESRQLNRKIKGILIACCCHHRCSWQSYVGKEYLKSKDIGEEEFSILLKISSWATCGNKAQKETADLESSISTPIVQRRRYEELDLPHEQRESLGFKSKEILDYGRSLYLKKQGFKSEVIYYIDKEISPENVAILATWD